MDFTISLAHFCEYHGPTAIFSTQPIEVPCEHCNPCVTPPSEDATHAPYSYNGLYDHSPMRLSGRLPQLSSPLETPPMSPRSPSHNPYFPSYTSSNSNFGSRRPSSTYNDDKVKYCDNCRFIVPNKYCGKLPSGAPGSPSKDGCEGNSPVLRTVQRFPVRGHCTAVMYNDLSSSPDSSDMSDVEPAKSFGSSTSSDPDSGPASPTFMNDGTHNHTVQYLSTHQPNTQQQYRRLRHNCLQIFSCENLPSAKTGSVMFGDEDMGYTIAYKFRVPEISSRGRVKEYALMALAGRNSCRASKAVCRVIETFENLAKWIIALAQKKLDRESARVQDPFLSRPTTALPTTPPLGTSASTMPLMTSPQKGRPFSSVASSPTTRNITPVSSFLSAKTVDPDGYPRARDAMQAKSLSEIVGRDEFFAEMHGIFCQLLHHLIRDLSRDGF